VEATVVAAASSLIVDVGWKQLAAILGVLG